MPSKIILTPIVSGGVYHIFNRGNNYEDVFFCLEDYQLFLNKIKQYLVQVCDILAFSLLPNHYHLLIRVKEDINTNRFSHQYKNCILSYTYLINKRDGRVGNIFHRHFKRLRVKDELFLKHLLFYIHYNPEDHEYIDDFRKYRFSSFQSFISNRPTLICRDEVIDWFDDIEGFIDFHRTKSNEEILKGLIME